MAEAGLAGVARAREIVEEAMARGPRGITLPVARVVEVLECFGLPVVAMRAVASPRQAVMAAELLGYPVVARVAGSPGVTLGHPDALATVCAAHPEVLVQVDIGPTRPAELWPPAFAAGVAALRAALPDLDDLDLVIEVDRAGRTWIVEATAHIRRAAPH